jgi:ATP-dependent Clp protease ATP-binding subunit ClpA
MLDEFIAPLKEKHIDLVIGDGVAKLISADTEGGVRGARDLRNSIRRKVEDKITDLIINSSEGILKIVNVSVDNNQIKVSAGE